MDAVAPAHKETQMDILQGTLKQCHPFVFPFKFTKMTELFYHTVVGTNKVDGKVHTGSFNGLNKNTVYKWYKAA